MSNPMKKSAYVVEFDVCAVERVAVLEVLRRVGACNEASAEFVFARSSYVAQTEESAASLTDALQAIGAKTSYKKLR